MNRFVALLVICLIALLPTFAHAQRVDQLPTLHAQEHGSSPRPSQAPESAPLQEAAPAPAPPPPIGDKIAAIINDGVITTTDIDARLRLAMLAAGLPQTTEVAQRLFPQILRSLIDEQLQLQEAKRLEISVNKDEIDKSLERIAQENHIPGGDMRLFVISQGDSPESLEQQVKASLAWNKVIQRELRPRVAVSDDEVDTVVNRIRANAGKQEFLVSEIFLTVDNPKDDEQVKQAADNLVTQLKGGANFGAVARQFSQSSTAGSNGDAGWIQEGQLPPELNKVLITMQPNTISPPIRATSGYYVLGLREKRTITLGGTGDEISINLQQVFRPYGTLGKDALLKDAARLETASPTCASLQSTIKQKFPGWSWYDLGDMKASKIPTDISHRVENVPVGKSTEPMATDKGALILYVCDRHVPEGKIDREAITNTLGTEKLELQARRQMRDLRRTAYIDIRLGKGS